MMGTFEQIKIEQNPISTGIFEARPFSAESAAKASQILQQNHENYHIYLHDLGLHNHILHHVLALYALGANATQLEKAFNLAIDSQRPSRKPDARRVLDFADPAKFKLCLGQGKYYDEYFAFFQHEISAHGTANTVNEFLFKGDEKAEDMLHRFFSGFLHSPIHLGYAIEFDQPLIAAEALAMTAIHESSFGETLKLVEQNAQLSSESKGLVQIQEEIHTNELLRQAMAYDHGVFQLRDGLLENARTEFLSTIGSWKVVPDELEEKTAESLNANIYWTTLAQRPDKQVRFDFFMMHSITAGSFWPVLNSVPWISVDVKCRLLEWKGRADLMLYCQCGAPRLYPEELTMYKPVINSGWKDIYRRACDYEDDGHLAKLIRAVATAAQLTRPYCKSGQFKITTEHDFLTVAQMMMDSGEQFNQESAVAETSSICDRHEYPRVMSPEIQRVIARWPRHVGFDEAWFHVPARRSLSQL